MNAFTSIGKGILFPIRFIREVKNELMLVTWPTRQATVRATIIVIVVSLAVGVYVAATDFIFTKGIEAILSLKQ
jgi:preprotein translocase subunit SecE